MDFILIFSSLIISACVIMTVKFASSIIQYLWQKKSFEKKLGILLAKSDDKLKASDKSMFKLEGNELDQFQKLLSRINYDFLLHIKNLIYFVELGEKLSVQQFFIYSICLPIVIAGGFKLYFPQMTVFSVFGVLLPYLYLLYLRDKKIKTFVSFFPGALESMASNLKAGADIIRAIQAVAHDEDNFFAKDFQLILSEIELGVAIHESFQNYAKKVSIPEVDLFALGITLSMQSGANLAVFFNKISDMIRKRIELKGKINIVTSESRFSMLIMSSAPVGIAMLQMSIDAQRYLDFLQSSLGEMVIYGSVGLITISILWVNALMKIEEV